MTYDDALSIASRTFTDLVIDPPNKDLPNMFTVRKTKFGHPHSLHLPKSVDPSHTPAEALEQETQLFLEALTAARTSLG